MSKIKKFNESLDTPTNSTEVYKWLRDISQDRDYVTDGVWDISDIDYVFPQPPNVGKYGKGGYVELPEAGKIISKWVETIKTFIDKYPDFVIADAYQTETPIWLAKKPTKRVGYIGSGFNHGSNNLIDNCPKRILICAEDD